jgi:ubiquinone/menaquinone biosynthesis C-methylase UbiE
VHRHGAGPYLKTLLTLATSLPAHAVLELGAGTGNVSRAFLQYHPCRFTGLDRSAAMLALARAKCVHARWILADACQLPLVGNSIDLAFAVFLLHHLPKLDTLMGECARVLRAEGIAAFVTTTHGFIDRHPMNRYFPSFARIDKSRFQTIPEIIEAMRRASFTDIQTHPCVDEPTPIDARYVEKVAHQFISTYTLIPQDEFERGLRALRADIAKYGQLESPIRWEAVTICGRITCSSV